MRLPIFTLIAFSILALGGCFSTNIKPGELPKANEGIAFLRVELKGAPSAMVHLYSKGDRGDRMGFQKALIDAIEGDHVYAVIMAQGEYDIGGISAEGMNDDWPKTSSCPAFNVVGGKNNYIGTLSLIFEPLKWYALVRKYEVRCNATADDAAAAWKMFLNSYEHLYVAYK